MYRHTYAVIDLKNLAFNVKQLTNFLQDYKYQIAVVKADVYGHGQRAIDTIIQNGVNYLACATLEEALKIRKKDKIIPILCLGIIPDKYIKKCINNRITITISSLKQLESINTKYFTCHIKINTGMNRLGISSRDELNEVFNLLEKKEANIEGLYTHMYNSDNNSVTNKQIATFKEICKDIDLTKIKIVHFGASGYALNYPKLSFVNGIRYGIAMYGILPNKIDLKSTFSLKSTIIQINEVEDAPVGYNGLYKTTGKEKIAVVPIGYADGILRANTGRNVFINGKKYPIVGNICMDMLFVKVDDSVNLYDEVVIINDNENIFEIAEFLNTIPYEIICSIGKRVPKVYKS